MIALSGLDPAAGVGGGVPVGAATVLGVKDMEDVLAACVVLIEVDEPSADEAVFAALVVKDLEDVLAAGAFLLDVVSCVESSSSGSSGNLYPSPTLLFSDSD